MAKGLPSWSQYALILIAKKIQKVVVTNMSITYSIEMDNSKFENVQDIIREITKAVHSLGTEMIKQQLEEMDLYIRDNRDKERYRCKDKRKTSINQHAFFDL